jgi:hypothetical protein
VAKEVQKARSRCKVAVLLVCCDYLVDVDCLNDLEYFAEAARRDELTLVWQLISVCDYKSTSLKDFQPLFRNNILKSNSEKWSQHCLDIFNAIKDVWEATFSHMVSNLATTSIEPESLDQLAERHNDFKPREVGYCLQKACEKLGTTLTDKYPDLHDMSWRNLKIYFSHGRARLDDSLFNLFSQELFAMISYASKIPKPTQQVLFVESDCYEWRVWDELTIIGCYTGHLQEAKQACIKLLHDQTFPDEQRPRIETNLTAIMNALNKK